MATRDGKKGVFSTPKKGVRYPQQVLYRVCNKGVVIKGRIIRNKEPKD